MCYSEELVGTKLLQRRVASCYVSVEICKKRDETMRDWIKRGEGTGAVKVDERIYK